MEEFKPMTFTEAEERATAMVTRLGVDVIIYRLKNGKFRITTNHRTIPINASIHTTITPSKIVY